MSKMMNVLAQGIHICREDDCMLPTHNSANEISDYERTLPGKLLRTFVNCDNEPFRGHSTGVDNDNFYYVFDEITIMVDTKSPDPTPELLSNCASLIRIYFLEHNEGFDEDFSVEVQFLRNNIDYTYDEMNDLAHIEELEVKIQSFRITFKTPLGNKNKS